MLLKVSQFLVTMLVFVHCERRGEVPSPSLALGRGAWTSNQN